MWATCHTVPCSNAGIPLDVGDLTEEMPDGSTIVMDVYCGVCGQQITDLSEEQPPMPPDPEEELEPDPQPDPPDDEDWG